MAAGKLFETGITQADIERASAIWEEGHNRIAGEAADASHYAEVIHKQVMANHIADIRVASIRAILPELAELVVDEVRSWPFVVLSEAYRVQRIRARFEALAKEVG